MPKPAMLEYVRIKDQLRQRVGRQWPVGTRLPPIRDLARQLGVGQCNALRAVRELADEGVLESRQRRGTFVADPSMRFGHAKSHHEPYRSAMAGKTVALLSYAADAEPFIFEMQGAIMDAIVSLGGIGRPIQFGGHPLDRLDEIDADAIVLLNYGPSTARWGDDQVMLTLTTVADTWASMPGGYDIVSVDQEQGAFLAGRRLKQAGIERVCFLGVTKGQGNHLYDTTSSARLVGFQRGWGCMLGDHELLVAKYYDPVQAGRAVAEFMTKNPRPQAVFAASDELAVGFIAGASAYGLEVGRDFHVIGFDGQRIGRELRGGPLTTIQVPASQMGAIGARVLAERLADRDQSVRRVHLGCTLFEGTTVGLPVGVQAS